MTNNKQLCRNPCWHIEDSLFGQLHSYTLSGWDKLWETTALCHIVLRIIILDDSESWVTVSVWEITIHFTCRACFVILQTTSLSCFSIVLRWLLHGWFIDWGAEQTMPTYSWPDPMKYSTVHLYSSHPHESFGICKSSWYSHDCFGRVLEHLVCWTKTPLESTLYLKHRQSWTISWELWTEWLWHI